MRALLVAVFVLPTFVTPPALAVDVPSTGLAPTTAASSPEAKALLKQVPRLSDQDPARQSYDVTATVGDGLARSWIFRAVYRAPDERAMYIYHALDGTPVVIVAGGHLVVFDAIHGKVWRVADYETHFALTQDAEDKLAVNWGFNSSKSPKRADAGGNEKKEPTGFLFDLPALFRGSELSVAPAQEGRRRLKGVNARGGTVDALLDPERPGHLELELASHDGKVGMVVDRVAIDQPMDDRLFHAPDLSGFGDRMEVIDRRPNARTPEELGRAIQEFSAAMMGRMAIHDAEWRQRMKGAFGRVDWQLAEAIDRIASPIVREVLGVAPGVHVPATRPSGAGANGGEDSNAEPANKQVGSTH